MRTVVDLPRVPLTRILIGTLRKWWFRIIASVIRYIKKIMKIIRYIENNTDLPGLFVKCNEY
jgi:hypothetical protein